MYTLDDDKIMINSVFDMIIYVGNHNISIWNHC